MKAKDKPKYEKSKAKTATVYIEPIPVVGRLSDFDSQLLSIIRGLGVTHSTVLRVLLRTNRFKVNQSLRTLWMAGLVHRDIQGLVISTKATDEDPELKSFIEKSFKTHLT